MAFEPSVAVFDACILYPFQLRNIVVQAAVDRLVEARWTDAIHDEWIRNLTVNAPAIPIDRLRVTRQLMDDALPTATIGGYEEHTPEVTLIRMIVTSLRRQSPPKDHSLSLGICGTFQKTS
ncbi:MULTISPECIES: hypothetical protein [unclassified Bradyrhizobium]|uniref:hypothetical protein n=1 Tax=Bradyrhizobium sp. USDA 4541 TaxID=2817704 RepID=UPI0020A3A82F|nr:hypothetical protein [Bradyrhizobium sp. USDA 4541]MCP1849721.1 hypothetical protein [Bradyrhizobium sp. USDA 4541]